MEKTNKTEVLNPKQLAAKIKQAEATKSLTFEEAIRISNTWQYQQK
jgi:hypothetical protein